ncbi:monovalent cation/H+ antiporter subunit D [Pseudaminobacter soli (ex Li et al. 2025)]|uniref:Monovalent cation/H+ antiporter subunit D n=1 Tax=Pseudaminobacter soli (ex Li et al. 2025) TaxID=1295366 RepID=A0A2P7SJP8_9HYPH|nr:monovalent cation/H+ antiporter subunit D [Mesorhizobium soli]PSJ62716.1 monovalent cation/H+ antiporter subunit D [Mesorhizobium soli]
MTGWSHHLIIAPVLLPLAAGALLMLYDERRQFLKATINLASTFALVVISIRLAEVADTSATSVYLLGNWPAPLGIVLVLDRLSALMLVLTSFLASAALVFALARWHKAGAHFHTLFQFLLMGLNGAFLTGDLFNLFVFFEVMLAASYGLVLHGSGPLRVKAGLHYIAINLAASFLFLIGVSLIYGVTGTLNMADLAVRISGLAAGDRILLEIGAAVLGVAFLVKAGMWPLSNWLPNAYSVAAAPVAAVFALLSKVGIYVLLRLSLLVFGAHAGSSADFGSGLLIVGGMATIAFGMIGVIASQALGRLASYSVLVSSGTLLAAIGMSDAGVTAGALFYLVSSTITVGALFLLIELIERGQNPAADILAVTAEAFGDGDEEAVEEQVGVAFPGTLAILGVCFAICGLLLAGLPPLSGFIGKFALLAAVLTPAAGTDGGILSAAWLYTALLILSGLAALLSMLRFGIRTFWAPIEVVVPRVSLREIVPVVLLLLLTLGLTIQGGPVMRYMQATASSLHSPQQYVDGVLGAPRVQPQGAKAE